MIAEVKAVRTFWSSGVARPIHLIATKPLVSYERVIDPGELLCGKRLGRRRKPIPLADVDERSLCTVCAQIVEGASTIAAIASRR